MSVESIAGPHPYLEDAFVEEAAAAAAAAAVCRCSAKEKRA